MKFEAIAILLTQLTCAQVWAQDAPTQEPSAVLDKEPSAVIDKEQQEPSATKKGSFINEPTVIIKETENTSVFKGLLFQVWDKVRNLSPKANVSTASRNRVIATAGVRSTETTGTLLQPYWKEDHTNDKQFMQELKLLVSAQDLIDEGQLEESKTALESFLSSFPESLLEPNALFSKGMVLSVLGDKQISVDTFEKFIRENPTHPLSADAKLIIAELAG